MQESKISPPTLAGLVLAGGKSRRMGQDKSQMVFHDKAQWAYCLDLLKTFCSSVFISCRNEQASNYNSEICILDNYDSIGPMGGILSAFEKRKDWAWLVLACDMPLIDASILELLVDQRDAHKLATAFIHSDSQKVEPLLAIWEPLAYPSLLEKWKIGKYSLQKIIQNEEVELIKAPHNQYFININNPENYEEIKLFLRNQQ